MKFFGKILALVFWIAKENLLIDCNPLRQTINDAYYANISG